MRNENAVLVLRWFEEVWNQRRAETVFELLTPESFSLREAGRVTGDEAFLEQVHGPFLQAFPDLKIEVLGTLADGDEVAVRWSATGTHGGDGLGVPATGRRVRFRGTS